MYYTLYTLLAARCRRGLKGGWVHCNVSISHRTRAPASQPRGGTRTRCFFAATFDSSPLGSASALRLVLPLVADMLESEETAASEQACGVRAVVVVARR